jgi:hypothetical protein
MAREGEDMWTPRLLGNQPEEEAEVAGIVIQEKSAAVAGAAEYQKQGE